MITPLTLKEPTRFLLLFRCWEKRRRSPAVGEREGATDLGRICSLACPVELLAAETALRLRSSCGSWRGHVRSTGPPGCGYDVFQLLIGPANVMFRFHSLCPSHLRENEQG